MDINMEWKKAGEGEDKELSALLNMPLITQLPSKDPVEKIKRAILLNACWGLLISGGYIFVLFRFPYWQILVCIGFVLLITLWGVVKTLILYRKLPKALGMNTLLQEMEGHYNNISQWINLQQWASLLIYPVSIAGGFMLGGSLGSGKPIAAFIQQPHIMLILLITVIILVPLCFYLARWMSHKAFGQYARQLKVNIDSLKKEG